MEAGTRIDPKIIEQIKKQLNTINAAPFFLCVSGSDNYGFASENNSDVDIRGAYYFKDPRNMFCLPIERKLTLEGEYFLEGMKYEWQLHEILKFYRLMSKSNMNILDWVFSDCWIIHPPEFLKITREKLREVSREFINQNLINHAIGWSKRMFDTDWNNPKKILHSLRPLMTCLYYLETGNYEPNIQKIIKHEMFVKYHNLVINLIELKKAGLPTNQILKQQAIKTYDELKKILENRKGEIPNVKDNSHIVDLIIANIRLRTIKQYNLIDKS
ncbi:MAG: nucleotidyltransferase domain-containing protein [Archaeoglobus sp.]|nr:nucleotidyltransferase domain-containing protein [Archaeoglobus sp.]